MRPAHRADRRYPEKVRYLVVDGATHLGPNSIRIVSGGFDGGLEQRDFVRHDIAVVRAALRQRDAFVFPNSGMYNLSGVAPSLGVNFDRFPQRTFQVTGK